MKIVHSYHRGDQAIDIVPSLAMTYRSGYLGLAALCSTVAYIAFELDQMGASFWVSCTVALTCVAIAMGRRVYSIIPNRYIRFQLKLLGFPVMFEIIPASSIYSTEIVEDGDGTAILRFKNSANQPLVTIEGFPARETAERVAALFNLDQTHRQTAVGKLIEEEIVTARQFSSRLGIVLVCIAFCTIPALVLLFGGGMDKLGDNILAGFILTFISAYAVRNDQGILAVSQEEAYIDRWVRRRLFQRLEYRQHLGDHPGETLHRIRFDPGNLFFGVLLLGQIACIYLATLRNEHSSSSFRSKESHRNSNPYDDEAVQRGMRRYQEAMERRKKSDSDETSPVPKHEGNK